MLFAEAINIFVQMSLLRYQICSWDQFIEG